MRHSRDEKSRSHERIIDVAARRIREVGTDTPSVAEIMTAAGMTQGGFYKHFRSRDELIAVAAERACTEGVQFLDDATEGSETPLQAVADAYLSARHRDRPGSGCAVAALGGDAARPDNPVSPAYTEQVGRYVDRLQRLLPPDSQTAQTDRDRAIAATSTLVGALLLARAVDDPAFSDEILSAARGAFSAPPHP